MSPSPDPPSLWYDRFFREEYLAFDEHPHTDLEIEFLLQFFAPEEKILDVGCGYGRHIIPLAQKGVSVTGIDRSPVMLNEARKTATNAGMSLRLLRGDMRALPFEETFDVCLSLFSSFGYFDAEDENFRVLQNIANALVPGGRFLLETVNRDFVVRHIVPTQVYRPGDLFLVEERQFDPVTSRSRVDVTVFRNGEQTHLYHTIRLYTFTEIEMLLTATGLVPDAVWGDFHGSEYTCDSPHMIVLAQKP